MPRRKDLRQSRRLRLQGLQPGNLLGSWCELMLGFRVRDWQIWTKGGCFIIDRDMRLVRGGQIL